MTIGRGRYIIRAASTVQWKFKTADEARQHAAYLSEGCRGSFHVFEQDRETKHLVMIDSFRAGQSHFI
jgi:hypothetical protein